MPTISTDTLRSAAASILPASAATATAAFLALTAVQITSPRQTEPFSRTSDYLIEALFFAGLAAAAITVVALHRWHRSTGARWGRLGGAAATLYGLGHLCLALMALATLVRGQDSLDGLFVPGFVGLLIGGPLLAAATFRALLLPRPLALLFAAAVPLAIAVGEPAGPVTIGALWLYLTVATIRTARDR